MIQREAALESSITTLGGANGLGNQQPGSDFSGDSDPWPLFLCLGAPAMQDGPWETVAKSCVALLAGDAGVSQGARGSAEPPEQQGQAITIYEMENVETSGARASADDKQWAAEHEGDLYDADRQAAEQKAAVEDASHRAQRAWRCATHPPPPGRQTQALAP